MSTNDAELALHSIISSDTNVSALVSSRVYAIRAQENAALPYVVFRRTGGETVRHTTGSSGLARAEFQVECWDDAYDDVKDLREKVRLSLESITPGTKGGVAVQGVFVDQDIDLDEITVPGEELGEFGVALAVRLWFTQSK